MNETSTNVTEYYRGIIVEPDCKGCPLEGSTKVAPEGNPRARIAIVSESPGYLEVQEGHFFAGQTGQLLNKQLAESGIQREEVWITACILCKPKTVQIEGKIISPDNVVRLAGKYCKSRLDGELAKIRPRVVIGLGTQSVRSVYSNNASLKGRRGAIHTLDLTKE